MNPSFCIKATSFYPVFLLSVHISILFATILLREKGANIMEIKLLLDPQDDLDNHADQCNPNNDEYWHSREQGEDDDE